MNEDVFPARFFFIAALSFRAPFKAGVTLPFVVRMNCAEITVFPGQDPVYDIDKTKVKERSK